MIAITSPAKTQDFETPWNAEIETSKPEFLKQTQEIHAVLASHNLDALQDLMQISEKLAKKVHETLEHWEPKHTADNSKPAVLAYQGDIYRQFDAINFSKEQQQYLQDHLVILTGFYGILKPYDLMQGYRLEMKTKLKLSKEIGLYSFWTKQVTDNIKTKLSKSKGDRILINLASKEYYKVLDEDRLESRVLDIEFRQRKDDTVKNYGIYAKKARGQFIKFMLENKITDYTDLLRFNLDGYQLYEESEASLQFIKDV